MSKIDANRKVNTFHKIITPIIQDFMFDKRFGQIITHGVVKTTEHNPIRK